ncbi:MAG TPA: hypothetical protein VK599_15160 [Streptosporangiaceae bacterium]|nr:hypothetical protein [Streptosporangiaceae bacterium]
MSSGATGDSPEERRAAVLAAEAERKAADLARETAATADSLAEATAARALALASALSETLGEIARRLDQYSAFGRRSRKIIVALAVSFALDIVLTVVLGLTAFSAHDTANANAQLVQEVHAAQLALHAAQLTVCANGNTFRADQDVIWRDFIGLITKPAPGESPAQVAKTDQLAMGFLGYVGQVNHAVDCKALYGK